MQFPARLFCSTVQRLSTAVLLLGLMFGAVTAAHAQEDSSLSPSLSEPLSDTLSNSTSSTGFNSEVVAGASSLSLSSQKSGVSDPTGSLLENSLRTPNVSAGVNSSSDQQFNPDVQVDSARASLINGYSGSRAAFQPAFSGTQMRSFSSTLRPGQQAAAGSQNSLGMQTSGASAFGRGVELQAFGTTGVVAPPENVPGLPLIYTDQTGAPPSGLTVSSTPGATSTLTSSLVTTVGNLPGLYTSPVPGTPLPLISSNGYAGPGNFSDSTRGNAGSPPDVTESQSPLLSSTGLSESPFHSLSQPGSSFLNPSLRVSGRSTLRTFSPETLATSPAQRQARIQAILSGHPQSPIPSFEQKRIDRLKNAGSRTGERPSHVVLSPSTQPLQ